MTLLLRPTRFLECPLLTLQEQFGQIDIYLFDQLLKGRITPGMRILDAGCGSGRNLVYFLREGYEVYAADADPQSVEGVRGLARMFAPALPASNFRVEPIEQMSFDDACADVVVSNAVLHFSRDDAHFEAMLRGSWRVLKPGGLFFCRLASTIGMESQFKRVQGRRFLIAGWRGTVPGGRGDARPNGRTDRRRTGRAFEDHRGARSTRDDHVGAARRNRSER